MADTSMEIILSILFLTFSNADVLFTEEKLIWRSYILVKALLIILQVQLINQKKFAAGILNLGKKIYIVHMVYLEATISIYSACQTQTALLVVEKVIISIEY